MPPSEFDHLRFDIELAIKLDTFVPRSKRERSDWAQHVSERIAERLRQRWEFTRKPGIQLGPGYMSGMKRPVEQTAQPGAAPTSPQPLGHGLVLEDGVIGRIYERRGLLLVPRATDTGRPDETISAEWFNSLSEDRKRQVMADGLGARLLHDGMDYVMPIFWLALDAEQSPTLRSGSAFLVDCGRGVFAVTAAHVFAAYCEAKRTAAQIACQIGNLLFDPEAQLIDSDTREGGTDIATFRLSPEDVATIDKPVLSFNEANRPPSPANEGDFAFFAGYPERARGMAPSGAYFAAVPYRAMTPITTITDRQITCRFNRDKMLDQSGQGLPPAGYDISGMSGGPFLIPALNARGIGWRLGGVVVEGAMGDLMEKIVAVHASYILPDGRLMRHAR